MKIDGRIGKMSYDNEVKTEPQHKTREAADAVVRADNPAANLVVTERFYIEDSLVRDYTRK